MAAAADGTGVAPCLPACVAARVMPPLVRSLSGASTGSTATATTAAAAAAPTAAGLHPATEVILVDDGALATAQPLLHAQVSRQEDGVLTAAQARTLPSGTLRWCAPFHLLATFAMMGLKPVHAAKCAHHTMQHAARLQRKAEARRHTAAKEAEGTEAAASSSAVASPASNNSSPDDDPDVIWVPLSFGLTPLPARSCVVLTQSAFTSLVHAALVRCVKHSTAHHQVLYGMCREITERRRAIVILLAGTSGTGKSTLASLLAERLRISSVVSTDSIRHTLRGQYSRAQCPHLHVSTYETDQMYNASSAVPSAAHASSAASLPAASSATSSSAASAPPGTPPPAPDETSWSLKKKVLHGYKCQSHLVLQHLTGLLHSYAASNQTVIVEGVHLLPKSIVQYMLSMPGCIPFFIYISNENKHRERFAIRSKYRTLDPAHNKYISSFTNIRIIQKYLVTKAEKLLIPCIDNTNVDRSVAAIHSVLIRCMKHLSAGHSLFDPTSHRAVLMHEEFSHSQQDAWSSKRMQQIIRMKVEKKELFQRLFAQSQHPQDSPSITVDQTSFTTSPRQASTSLAEATHSPQPQSPLHRESRTPTQLHEDHDVECSALGGGRSRSMSVSYRRASISEVPHDEDGFDLFQTGSPSITNRSLREQSGAPFSAARSRPTVNLSPAAATPDSTPPNAHSPAPDSLPLAASSRSRLARVAMEVDSEEDTPMASDVDTSGTEAEGDTESQWGRVASSRRHAPRVDTVSQATPSLYSYDDPYGGGDAEEEHEHDRNMGIAILQEEDEDESDESDVDDREEDQPDDDSTRAPSAVHRLTPASLRVA